MADYRPEADRGGALADAAAGELSRLHDLRDALGVQIAEQAERAVEGLRLHVAEQQLNGAEVSRDLVKRLYWQCPDVKVCDLVQALGVRSVHAVITAAGPGQFVKPCRRGCGLMVGRLVTSRAAA